MKKCNALLILYLILLSCSNVNKGNMKREVKENSVLTEHFPVIDFDKTYPEKDIVLQDIANITYIPLESNDSTMLSGRPFMTMTNDYFIVRRGETLLFFKKDGSYSHTINHLGSSGMEYTAIYGMSVDEATNEVFIYDLPTSHRVLVYNMQGEYKRTFRLPWTPPKNNVFTDGIYDFDKDYLFAEDVYLVDWTGDDIERERISKTPYYKISKKDGSLVSLPLSVKDRIRDKLFISNNENAIAVPLFMSPVAKIGSDMIVADYSLDTVYTYRDETFEPIAIRLNHQKEETPILATIDAMSNRYLFWYTVVKDIDIKNNHISDPVTYLFDKYTGECFKIGITNADGISSADYAAKLQFKYRLSGNLHVVPKGYALEAYPADFLVEQYEAGKLKGRLKEIASKLDEADNPVLMLVKFKE